MTKTPFCYACDDNGEEMKELIEGIKKILDHNTKQMSHYKAVTLIAFLVLKYDKNIE